jgi:hypothetical protein
VSSTPGNGAFLGGLEFQIVTPPGWWELPIMAPDVHAAVTTVVDERLAIAPPEARHQRDAVIQGLTLVALQARLAGAIYAAQIGVRTEAFEFALALMVLLREVPLELGHEEEELLAMVSALQREEVAGDEVQVDTVALGRLGTGIRDHRRRRIEGVPTTSVTYWFHVRGTPQVAVIKVTAPTAIDHVDDILPLLDGIVGSMVIMPIRGERADS